MAFFAFGHLVCTTMGQKEALQDQYMKHVAVCVTCVLKHFGFMVTAIGRRSGQSLLPHLLRLPAAHMYCTCHTASHWAHMPQNLP
jgi:hypothetical protein